MKKQPDNQPDLFSQAPEPTEEKKEQTDQPEQNERIVKLHEMSKKLKYMKNGVYARHNLKP